MKRALLLLVLLLAVATAAVWRLNVRGEADIGTTAASAANPAQIARGAYLARAGNCQDCHTPRGAAPYSGGRGIPTPFGTVYSTNLTPDAQHGIGAWTPADFRRALHNGRARDGRLLYPAFPYDAYTRISTDDADALFAYLRSLPAVAQANRPHELRFPYNTQAALAVWRALFFRPGRFEADPARTAGWNRGAYLVQGLGHCAACHAPRNLLGATRGGDGLRGGLIPLQNWYAPPLQAAAAEPLAQLLRTGRSDTAALLGPMAEVALHSTQHLTTPDLRAMAEYLHSLPVDTPVVVATEVATAAQRTRGETLYQDHCARCHGAQGQGVPGAYVALAGNPAVLQATPVNLVQVVLGGAFTPTTAGNPRPFGMPPFATTLADADIAAVLSYVRSAWGNQAGAVQALDIQRSRDSVRP